MDGGNLGAPVPEVGDEKQPGDKDKDVNLEVGLLLKLLLRELGHGAI